MFLDRRSLWLLALTAVILVAVGFVLGRWSVRRQTEIALSGAPVPVASATGAAEGEAAPRDVPWIDPHEVPGSASPSGAQVDTETVQSPPTAAAPENGQSPPAAGAAVSSPAASTAPRPRAKGSGYVVQVYATEDEAKARQVEERLRSKGYEASMSSFTTRGRTYHRVRVGPYSDRVLVLEADRKLREEEGLKTWIIRL